MSNPPDLAIISPVLGPRQKPLQDYYNRKEAARYLTDNGLPISVQTLANMASNNNKGKGPPFDRVAWGMVRYRREDLDKWSRARTVRIV
jgi:hypothetical protein